MRIQSLIWLLFAGWTAITASSCYTTQTVTSEGPQLPPTTIILVRHAEKDFGDDPNLTPVGHARAQRLAKTLKNVRLDAIYSTDTRRTLQTADPVASQKQIKVKLYEMHNLEPLAEEIMEKHTGETILVVGHSNTTPALASLLDKQTDYPRFSELDYENLWILSIPQNGIARLMPLKF